jgi:hypothetical protein
MPVATTRMISAPCTRPGTASKGFSNGYIPAAARLADPRREMPLQIYMPESGLTLEALADNVNEEFPRAWLSENKIDVTDDYLAYAQPLIGTEWARIPLENGIQRFTRFTMTFAEKKGPAYTPQAYQDQTG